MKTSLVIVAILFMGFSDLATGSYRANYRITVRQQVGTHLTKPLTDLATNRVLLDMSQNFVWQSGFQAHVSGRIRTESAYSANSDRFTDEQADKDSSNIEWRDAYLQYKQGSILLRLGQQQVVWGEAFGFFYADIINPKDIRESFLFGLFEFADLRDPIPLADFQIRGRDWTLQALYGPLAAKNRMPRWDAPLSALKTEDLNNGLGATVEVVDDVELDGPKGDYGGRASVRFGRADVSLFGLSYMDRMPYYEIVGFQPVPYIVQLRERQSRVQSYGLTATYDWSGYLLRFESVFTLDRKFNMLEQAFAVEKGRESAVVMGLDFPTGAVWMVSFQLSHSWISGLSADPGSTKAKQSLAAFRVARDIGSKQSFEIMSHLLIEDGSHYHTGRWIFARSSRLEFLIGIELLEGTDSSVFGKVKDGSRSLVGLRGFFDG